MLTTRRSRRMPALLTTMSTSPNTSTVESMRCLAASKSAMSSPLATAWPPAATISATTDSAGVRPSPPSPEPSCGPPVSFTTTAAPSLANSRAWSRPRPRPAPVMIAVRPSSAPIRGTVVVGTFPAKPGLRASGGQDDDRDLGAALDLRARLEQLPVEVRLVEDAAAHTHQRTEMEPGVLERLSDLGERHATEVGQRHEVGALRRRDRDRAVTVDVGVGNRGLHR